MDKPIPEEIFSLKIKDDAEIFPTSMHQNIIRLDLQIDIDPPVTE